ncbi:peptidase M22, glycoprotease [Candidatus Omnitrophus magneticus]|uniref:Peptidase M22, glycoprotease n=1 Tax=Candidatus Omnitrophus magneticus TaxID=1609969 RepID=A0A0F0CK40_9BACT|nr:peptidase M22, glycoprotease [Candidatus Omnitrophus magneticus]
MKILSFDTSTKFLTIALAEDFAIKSAFHEDMETRHNEEIVPTVANMFKEIKWNVKDIDLVCVGIGPGSFTGLRVGLAFAKGLARSTGIKIIGVPTMDAIAKQFLPVKFPGVNFVAPLIDARKGRVYSAVYKAGAETIPEKVSNYNLLFIDELLSTLDKKTFFIGDGVETYKDKIKEHARAYFIENAQWHPNARDINFLGLKKFMRREENDINNLQPLYIYPKECSVGGI